jgi:hypothetical protein
LFGLNLTQLGPALISVVSPVATFVVGMIVQWARKRVSDAQHKFAGRWEVRITWEPDWARQLFGMEVTEPHSEGDLFLAYIGSVYWGLSFFRLLAGATEYSKLCVYLKSIRVVQHRRWFMLFFPTWNLKECYLESAVRQKTIADFNYGPFVRYHVVFTASSLNELEGYLTVPGHDNATAKVGILTATRVGRMQAAAE